MPRPCQVSQCPGSASRYSPWRRSSSCASSAAWVSGSGRVPQISQRKTILTGIASPKRNSWPRPTMSRRGRAGAAALIAAAQLRAGSPPRGLDVEGASNPQLAQVADDRAVCKPRGARVQARANSRGHERHVLVGKARHRAGHADAADVGTAAEPVDPAADRHVALDDRPLAAELDQAAAVAVRIREQAALGEPGAVAALMDGAAEDLDRSALPVEL